MTGIDPETMRRSIDPMKREINRVMCAIARRMHGSILQKLSQRVSTLIGHSQPLYGNNDDMCNALVKSPKIWDQGVSEWHTVFTLVATKVDGKIHLMVVIRKFIFNYSN